MKRRKWYIWGWILAVCSLLKYVLTFVFENQALKKFDVGIFDYYTTAALLAGGIIYMVSLIGFPVVASKAIKDLKKNPESVNYNYFFPSFVIMFMVKVVFDILTIFQWETGFMDIERKISEVTGGFPESGHPTGMLTAASVLVGFIELVIAIIMGITIQIVYRRKCKKINE